MNRNSRRGANAIEFALTFPAFLALVFGMMDYGYLFMVQAGLDNAVSLSCREGAMIDPSVGVPASTAATELAARSALFCSGGCTLNVVDMKTGAFVPPNRTLICTATRNLPPLVGWVPFPASVASTSYYRLEWQRN